MGELSLRRMGGRKPSVSLNASGTLSINPSDVGGIYIQGIGKGTWIIYVKTNSATWAPGAVLLAQDGILTSLYSGNASYSYSLNENSLSITTTSSSLYGGYMAIKIE